MMDTSRPLPLAGTTVLDFGQFIAMPFCTLWLAWLGAEVIVVESKRRLTSRSAPPFAPGLECNPDASGYFNLLYSAKKSCVIDMTTPAGRDIARRLAAGVDVVVDNFTTGVMEKLGLGYADIAALNPSVIMVSNGAFGRTGPMKNSRGLHSAVNLFSGVADVTAYVDGAPRILGGCLPDPLSGTFSNFAILSALYNRKRTGEGQFVDVAMYEAMLTLIPEAVIDLTLNGNEPQRAGNRDPQSAPHGIYRCRDHDTWIAISVDGEAAWSALCGAAAPHGWASDPRFASVPGRRANVAALDLAVEAWTRSMEVHAAVERLQAVGVAAGPVLRVDELLDNDQLQARGTVVTVEHPVAGQRRQIGLPWQMDTFGVQYTAAPLLGEHTHAILTGRLGISEAEYARLEADGVLA
jgi:crotonobetainyl-CoA:carnitine CoA-transferase CaiB-like acyl-CoA transferase